MRAASRCLKTIAVDRSNLLRFSRTNPKIDALQQPLLAEIIRDIQLQGPITVAQYIQTALTHHKYGYYMHKDVFGKSGDFVTAPELSPVFGELVGCWLVAAWQGLGAPERVRVIEAGPGRGTLLADVIRASRSFPGFQSAVSFHLLEVSPHLRKTQKENLRLADPPMQIEWHDTLEQIPNDAPTLVIGHELLDALPIHQFVLTAAGWREKLVDMRVDSPETSDGSLVHTGKPNGGSNVRDLDLDDRHLNFVLAHSPSPASILFEKECNVRAQMGSVESEVCPSAREFVRKVALRVSSCRGAALFIDYGSDDMPRAHTLRGILRHRFVHPLHSPGRVDLSADVDFGALRRVVERFTPSLLCGSILTQRTWLAAMGIEERTKVVLRGASSDDEFDSLVSASVRLVDMNGMGGSYRAFSFCHPSLGHGVLPGI